MEKSSIPLVPEANIIITILDRTYRYTDINIDKNLLLMLKKSGFYKKNINKLQNEGLTKFFKKLKHSVNNNNLYLQLFLYGINNNSIFITEYRTQRNKILEITSNSICRKLYTEYFNKNEIIELCKKHPLYNEYNNI